MKSKSKKRETLKSVYFDNFDSFLYCHYDSGKNIQKWYGRWKEKILNIMKSSVKYILSEIFNNFTFNNLTHILPTLILSRWMGQSANPEQQVLTRSPHRPPLRYRCTSPVSRHRPFLIMWRRLRRVSMRGLMGILLHGTSRWIIWISSPQSEKVRSDFCLWDYDWWIGC